MRAKAAMFPRTGLPAGDGDAATSSRLTAPERALGPW